jgi:uncharacterized protein
MVEWNGDKARSNLIKHGVSFIEATSVLDDPLALTLDDRLHSIGEIRLSTIGYSDRHRILVVIYTERNNTIRIISARPATPKERKIYEQDL